MILWSRPSCGVGARDSRTDCSPLKGRVEGLDRFREAEVSALGLEVKPGRTGTVIPAQTVEAVMSEMPLEAIDTVMRVSTRGSALSRDRLVGPMELSQLHLPVSSLVIPLPLSRSLQRL